MNDAHSPRRDAAGGPGRDRRPEDPYDPYTGEPQQQPGPYGQDPYAGQYQQQPDHYSQGPYPGGQQQDGYGYDPYGAQPGQGHPGYQTGEYQPGQYDTGQYDTGQFPTGQYDTGQYDTGQFPTGQYQTGQYQTGEFPTGEFQTGEFQTGQYDTGQSATDGYDTGEYDTGQYPVYPEDLYAQQQQQARVPQQAQRPPSENPYEQLGALDPESTPADREANRAAKEYRTEQFSFVDDEEEDEEVIDWLKFAETRSERRDERKRRGRNRRVALVVALVLAVVGGLGYLWQRNGLPFVGGEEKSAAPAAGQKRDVIVVHLKELDSDNSSTALLVNNETAGKGTTVLLPNSLAVSTDDAASTTLGKSVDSAGAGPTRDALSALLGADIKGTWRLDTPFLEVLVESVGGIQVDTDVEVEGKGKKDKGKTIVPKGEKQQLKGVAAVAYATHRGAGESVDKQLARFGQVMQSVLKKIPSTAASATRTVQSLGQVADPSLPDSELGASLAALAEQAKTGSYKTLPLPVQADGTLDEKTTKGVVRDVLGGTVKNTDPDATPSVRVQNATGRDDASGDAQVDLVNSGYTFVRDGKAAKVAAKSTVEYSDPGKAKLAQEVAQTLGLPKSAVKKASGGAQGSQIRVVLGQDYKD